MNRVGYSGGNGRPSEQSGDVVAFRWESLPQRLGPNRCQAALGSDLPFRLPQLKAACANAEQTLCQADECVKDGWPVLWIMAVNGRHSGFRQFKHSALVFPVSVTPAGYMLDLVQKVNHVLLHLLF